ncbi:type II secretion system protein GspM [Candidatus Stoquefichus massiliensis]|uniref:type II secretion system protein GspM n=1 Tax=Candidatus Stoquefichus massiliensis TaxID=1470350 RepID=UPI000482BF52|nr:type II secretion system protein GspM [Candidatus Stoquefichus massiliensis]
MESLTKREKTLIYVLICFLILVAGWFLLLNPALEKNSQVHAEYEEKQTQLTTIKQQLKDYEDAPSQYKILEDSYNEIAGQYSQVLSNDDIDKLITTKVLASGFRPKNLSIGEVPGASLQSTDTTATDGTANPSTDNSATSSVIKQSTINMTLNGDLTKLKKLMGSINEQEGLEIGNLSYQLSNAQSNTVTISFVIYMIEKQ